MNHQDHMNLISKAIPKGGTWADLGSGHGAFTFALAECLGKESHIYSVDLDQRALDAQRRHMDIHYPDNPVDYLKADFTRPLKLPPLDGVLMANSLHFINDKAPIVKQIRDLLKPTGRLVLVEYDTAEGNYAVPYPLTYAMWVELAQDIGFSKTELVATRPSQFLGAFFCALSWF